MEKLPIELKRKITENIEPRDFTKFSSINKQFKNIVKETQKSYTLIYLYDFTTLTSVVYGNPENLVLPEMPEKMKVLTFKHNEKSYVRPEKDYRIDVISIPDFAMRNVIFHRDYDDRTEDVKNNNYWILKNIIDRYDYTIKEYDFDIESYFIAGKASSKFFIDHITNRYDIKMSIPDKVYQMYLKKYSYNYQELINYLFKINDNHEHVVIVFDEHSIQKNNQFYIKSFAEFSFEKNYHGDIEMRHNTSLSKDDFIKNNDNFSKFLKFIRIDDYTGNTFTFLTGMQKFGITAIFL